MDPELGPSEAQDVEEDQRHECEDELDVEWQVDGRQGLQDVGVGEGFVDDGRGWDDPRDADAREHTRHVTLAVKEAIKLAVRRVNREAALALPLLTRLHPVAALDISRAVESHGTWLAHALPTDTVATSGAVVELRAVAVAVDVVAAV
eukprot:scaffold10562_cov63-Phaeocystis_antarctica.AAC.1